LKLGIEIAQSSVAKYMLRRRGPPSQGWKTFLRNHAPDIAAVDLFVVPTISFKLLYGLAIIHLERRHLVWTNATTNPTAEWIARQITEAFPWDQAPRYLIRDRDSSYGAVVTQRIQAMGIRDRPTAARSPWQNGHVERPYRLDPMRVPRPRRGLERASLHRILKAYASYYNRTRTHLALAKDAPIERLVQTTGAVVAIPLLGGLHHQYARMAQTVGTGIALRVRCHLLTPFLGGTGTYSRRESLH
jgi:transposase InsO family protein